MRDFKDQLKDIKVSLGISSVEKPIKMALSKNKASKDNRNYRKCPECGCNLRYKNFDFHMIKQHGKESRDDRPKANSEVVKCPKCSSRMKKKNLKKHIRRVHDRKTRVVKNQSSKSIPAERKSTVKEAIEIKKALDETNLVSDKAIAQYLAKNPSNEKMGKFGVPQDKYRYGFYGSKTMDYDVWSKGEKGK